MRTVNIINKLPIITELCWIAQVILGFDINVLINITERKLFIA